MITLEDVERKREYVLALEPSISRTAALQILDDLEYVVRELDDVKWCLEVEVHERARFVRDCLRDALEDAEEVCTAVSEVT